MYRPAMLSIVALALLAVPADAIEMFTNFNNGQNVGFPPMEVPISVYRGFGHGGWNPYAEGMPLKTNPPVPAMMPTGQVPHIWQQPQYGGMPAGNQQQMSGVQAGLPQRVAIDRRRGRWQRGGYRPTIDNGGAVDAGMAPNAGRSPEPAGPEVDSEPATVKAPTSSRRTMPNGNGDYNPPTILHVQPGMAPAAQSLESTNSVPSGDEAAPQPPAAIKRDADMWPAADALFPRDDAG